MHVWILSLSLTHKKVYNLPSYLYWFALLFAYSQSFDCSLKNYDRNCSNLESEEPFHNVLLLRPDSPITLPCFFWNFLVPRERVYFLNLVLTWTGKNNIVIGCNWYFLKPFITIDLKKSLYVSSPLGFSLLILSYCI